MLDRVISRERQEAVRSLLRHYGGRYLAHPVLVPSARFALYAAAKELLSPGDRVIISPITCQTVIEALMAAGVTPVFVDIESATGNIDVGRLPGALLASARAIVTTNLYGNPDCVPELGRIAAKHGLLLIEDCAHVIQTRVGGHQVGSAGDVSVFSFKKYFDQPGGVIALRDGAAARKIQDRVAIEAAPPSQTEERLRYIQLRLRRATSAATTARLSRICGPLLRPPPAAGHSEEAQPAVLRSRGACLPTTASLLSVTGILSGLDRFIAERMSIARDLIAHCPLRLKRSGYAEEVCYLVVPFFSEQRDAIVDSLKQRRKPTYFLYTPPMNIVFGGRLPSIHRLDTDVIDEWCRHTLPIDPRRAGEYLDAIRSYAPPS